MWDNVSKDGISMGTLYHFVQWGAPKRIQNGFVRISQLPWSHAPKYFLRARAGAYGALPVCVRNSLSPKIHFYERKQT